MNKKLIEYFWVEFIYGSSVVGGAELNKKEVEEIVKNGRNSKLLKNNPRKDLLQAYGQRQALEFIEKLAKGKKETSVNTLLELHNIVFQSISGNAGKYRDNYIKLRSSALMPSFPFAIQADMRDFNEYLKKAESNLHSDNSDEMVEFISKVYHSITRIHPFSDGNGRTARLFVNLILRKYGYPYILVPKVDNEKNMRIVLRAADMGDLKPLIKFNKVLLQQSLKKISGAIS